MGRVGSAAGRRRDETTARVANAYTHYQTDGKDGAGEDLDEAGVVGVDAGGAAADDLGEEASEGEHDACADLGGVSHGV